MQHYRTYLDANFIRTKNNSGTFLLHMSVEIYHTGSLMVKQPRPYDKGLYSILNLRNIFHPRNVAIDQ